MTFDFKAGSSPLTSRQNPIIYLIILFTLIVIGIFLCIWIAIQINRKKTDTPEYREKEKNRPTKYKDIKALAKLYFLTPQDMKILWYICKTNNIPNILYSIKELNKYDNLIQQAYSAFKKSNSAIKINNLFKLKFKLEKIFASSEIINSTYIIPLETKLFLVSKNGSKFPCTYFENTKDYFAVLLAPGFEDYEEKPEPLDRIAFSFTSETGLPYAIVTRLIRYQERDDKKLMIAAHSKELITKTQRNYKRLFLNETSRFASVKSQTDKNGNEAFIINENKYQCTLTNLSGGGCCLKTSLPIKEGQIICVEMDFYDGTDSAIGKIIKTRKADNLGSYNLHIQFIKISIETQNKILAKVYGYD